MAGDGLDALRGRKANASRGGKQGGGDRVRRTPPPPMHRKAPSPTPDEAAPEPEVPEQPAPKPASTPRAATPVEPETPSADEPATERGVPTPEPEQPSSASTQLARYIATPPAAAGGARDWDAHQSPPRPAGVPRAEEVLQQRFIKRESLNASVPVELQISHRIQVLKVVSRINQIPPADLIAVALDWFLRGGEPSSKDMLPPWNEYTGPGTDESIPRAEEVLQRRFLTRESIKASVPEPLDFQHRLTVYKLLNRLDKAPIGDIVAVAMDRWLRVMGY